MGETGSITRGWKEEESCTREWFCILGLGKPRPKTQHHSLVQDSSSFHPLVMEPLFLPLRCMDNHTQSTPYTYSKSNTLYPENLFQIKLTTLKINSNFSNEDLKGLALVSNRSIADGQSRLEIVKAKIVRMVYETERWKKYDRIMEKHLNSIIPMFPWTQRL